MPFAEAIVGALPERGGCYLTSIRLVVRRSMLAATTLLAIGVPAGSAHAQGKLEARYVVSLAGVPIGRGTWVVDIADTHYTATGSGGTSGLLQVIASGRGSATVRGEIAGGRPVAKSYSVNVSSSRKQDEVRMSFGGGNVRNFSATPPVEPAADRVPVVAAHRRGVLDPLTAVLIPVPGSGEAVGPQACNRTLPIFDGRNRFDIVLSFKRMETAHIGYRGPVAVCRIVFRPIAGHRPGRKAIEYLAASRGMEIWLAPIVGTRILVPYRLQVPTALGAAVLQATQFASGPQARRPVPASAATR